MAVMPTAKHATRFRVYEDEKKTVIYYLVHMTNNDLGMREMKKAMVKKWGDMTFWPVTVKNPGQLELQVTEGPPHPTLQQHLRETYAGKTMTFEELLNINYPSGDAWLEPQYRAAIKGMEKEDPPQVVITRVEAVTLTEKPSKALKLPDTVAIL